MRRREFVTLFGGAAIWSTAPKFAVMHNAAFS
jgi:hypothetical protein